MSSSYIAHTINVLRFLTRLACSICGWEYTTYTYMHSCDCLFIWNCFCIVGIVGDQKSVKDLVLNLATISQWKWFLTITHVKYVCRLTKIGAHTDLDWMNKPEWFIISVYTLFGWTFNVIYNSHPSFKLVQWVCARAFCFNIYKLMIKTTNKFNFEWISYRKLILFLCLKCLDQFSGALTSGWMWTWFSRN